MKGIIYCRVSSQEQVRGTSLENQQAVCEAYAQSKNISVERVFIERGESATAAARTELLKALDYCKDNKTRKPLLYGSLTAFLETQQITMAYKLNY
jgi:site-specific DNA recombinase